jgi:hypothetical protein
MGCWDIYCFLCGNSCHKVHDDIQDSFLEYVETYENSINNPKTKKWYKTKYAPYFKPIYEKYKKNPKLFLDRLNNIYKNSMWLDDCTFLTANNEIIHDCEEVNCNIMFRDKKGNFYRHCTESEYLNPEIYGVFVHTDCWQYIKKEYNINLSFSYLPLIKKNVSFYKIFDFINYGPIEKYWKQDFDVFLLTADSNDELINSPLKSKLVAKNIKKVISKLKIKFDPKRKGPLVSATFYENNTYKVGSNGNIWFIKNNKWNEIKDTVKYKFTTKNNNLFKKISYSGDVNTTPIFVLKIETNNKIYIFEILITKEYLNKITNKYTV